MNASHSRAVLFSLLLLAALTSAGCGWARPITWELPFRDAAHDPSAERLERERVQDADSYKDVAAQRAKNDADFAARNPGAKPGR